LAGNVVDKANYVVGSVVDLPQNVADLVTQTPELIQAIGWHMGINTYGIAEPTERAKNIVDSIHAMYRLTAQEAIQAVHRDGITFDENGYPVYP
jgi:hypothetical protein